MSARQEQDGFRHGQANAAVLVGRNDRPSFVVKRYRIPLVLGGCCGRPRPQGRAGCLVGVDCRLAGRVCVGGHGTEEEFACPALEFVPVRLVFESPRGLFCGTRFAVCAHSSDYGVGATA
jgi:hypothetical protein